MLVEYINNVLPYFDLVNIKTYAQHLVEVYQPIVKPFRPFQKHRPWSNYLQPNPEGSDGSQAYGRDTALSLRF